MCNILYVWFYVNYNLYKCSLKLLLNLYYRGKKCRPVYTQIGQQVVKLRPEDLRLPARAWKVKLIGEGADDAGGVFDDTITEMCQVSFDKT